MLSREGAAGDAEISTWDGHVVTERENGQNTSAYTHMLKTLLGGVILAVFGALTVALGDVLGLDLDHVALLGAALGAVVGLVPDRTPLMRVLGFVAGMAIGWVVFGLRAGYLPDTSAGRAVAAFIAIILCLAVAAASMRHIPLWSTLLGVAGIVGTYEATYTNAPSQFIHESGTAFTTLLLAAAMGHLATTILGPEIEHERGEERAKVAAPPGPVPAESPRHTPLAPDGTTRPTTKEDAK